MDFVDVIETSAISEHARAALRSLVGHGGSLLVGIPKSSESGAESFGDFYAISAGGLNVVLSRLLCPVDQDGSWDHRLACFVVAGDVQKEFPGVEFSEVLRFDRIDRIQTIYRSDDTHRAWPAGLIRVTLDGAVSYLVWSEPFLMVHYSRPNDVSLRDSACIATSMVMEDL